MSSSTLDQVLNNYTHLDLTDDVAEEPRDQMGGGGYSDVFRAQMHPGWKVRSDSIIEELLLEIRNNSPELISDRVAVKRLRIWGKSNPTVDKVIRDVPGLPVTVSTHCFVRRLRRSLRYGQSCRIPM